MAAMQWNLMGGIGAIWRFRIAKTILLQYPQLAPQQPSWSSVVSSPWALLKVSLCRGLLTRVSPSSVCLSVTFHIFNNSITIVSIMAAILKIFSCYLLPNCKSDGAETWWKASGQHGDLELLKHFHSDINEGRYGNHLENLQITSAPKW